MAEINWTKLEEKGIKKIDDDRIEVTTKDGVFVLVDVAYDKIKRAQNRNKKNPEVSLVSEMIESMNGETKRVGEATIESFRGSSMGKLSFAATILTDEDGLSRKDDFLGE